VALLHRHGQSSADFNQSGVTNVDEPVLQLCELAMLVSF
jgi:hypothetical protein